MRKLLTFLIALDATVGVAASSFAPLGKSRPMCPPPSGHRRRPGVWCRNNGLEGGTVAEDRCCFLSRVLPEFPRVSLLAILGKRFLSTE
jgi:hypothetical protein